MELAELHKKLYEAEAGLKVALGRRDAPSPSTRQTCTVLPWCCVNQCSSTFGPALQKGNILYNFISSFIFHPPRWHEMAVRELSAALAGSAGRELELEAAQMLL